MTRTQRLIKLATARGDRAALAILEGRRDERCTASTGIASHPVCGGTREQHGTADGPFHPFTTSR